MVRKEAKAKNNEERKPRIGTKVAEIVLISVTLMIFLALLSFHPEDVVYLEQGIEGTPVWRNWIGFFGAVISRTLILLFGFAVYPVVFICLLSFCRRARPRSKLRPAGWEYWTGFVLILIGGAMLFAINPRIFSGMADRLNIALTPGGVIGQYLCDPVNGKISVVLNQGGSALISSTLIFVGFVVIWLYDWYDAFVFWYVKRRQRRLEKEATGVKNEKAKTPAGKSDNGASERLTAEERDRILRTREQEGGSEAASSRAKAGRAAGKAGKRNRTKDTAGRGEKDRRKESVAAPSVRTAKSGGKKSKDYELPPIALLDDADDDIETTVAPKEVENKKVVLQATLDSFNIDAKVGQATSGPRVTLFEVEPAPGVKVERISNLSNNIAMELRAQSLRILTPIPGRKSVGIEVPNDQAANVSLRGLMETSVWRNKKVAIPLLLGRDISGKPVLLDLAKAPHLLIAGATGSGKSVCINALIMSLLYRFSPEEMRLLLIDPKVVEFSGYNSLPHLVVPVITEAKKVVMALRWVINEMEKRYTMFASVGARNIAAFNARAKKKNPRKGEEDKEIPDRVPYIILIIDELADIMMTAKSDVETSLARIAQLSRAVGIHTIIATQRPSVNVITGVIKANYPTRIAFQVTSQIDSRTILDGKGAEKLLGRGDMLFKPPGASQVERNQSPMVNDHEIEAVVNCVSAQGEQRFDPDVFKSTGGAEEGEFSGDLSEGDEKLIERAIEIILQDRRATTSYVQRCLRIGYNRAALIMEILEQRGVVGPQIGSAPREILISRDDAEEDTDDDYEDETSEEYSDQATEINSEDDRDYD